MRIARLRTPAGPRHVVQREGAWVEVVSLTDHTPTGASHPLDGAHLLAPCEPVLVLGAAHNSGPEGRELPQQAFQKSARTVVGPGEPILREPGLGSLVVECELAVVIARPARHVRPEEVESVVLGYTVGNDVTLMDQTERDGLLLQAKNGEGFTPLGPWIETGWLGEEGARDVLDGGDVGMQTLVDGHVAADSSVARLGWTIREQIVHLTRYLTLGPGDVVLTGSPGTDAPVEAGQLARVRIAGIGELANPVELHPGAGRPTG